MIYITKNNVIVHDYKYLTEDEKETAWPIEQLPEPEAKEGYRPVRKIDYKSQKIWYEYEKIKKSKEELQAEEIEKLKKQLAQCQQSITELTALAATMGTPTV